MFANYFFDYLPVLAMDELVNNYSQSLPFSWTQHQLDD